MKHLIIFFLTIFCILSASMAQEPTLQDLLSYKNYAKENNLTSSDDYVYVLSILAEMYRDMNDCNNYIANATEAYNIVKVLRPNTEELANIAGTCAHAYSICNNNDSAMSYYKQSFLIFNSLGNKQYETILAWFIGAYYLDKQNFVEAEHFLKIAYTNKDLLDKQTLELLYFSMYEVAEMQYNYTDAATYMKMYYEIVQEIYGENSYEFSLANSSYAKLLLTIQKYGEAENYLLKNLLLAESYYGKKSAEYITAISDLGLLYVHLDNYPKAEKLYREAIELSILVYGKNSIHYTAAILGYGNLHAGIGSYDIAEQMLLESLTIERTIVSEESIDTIANLQSLGNLYLGMCKYQEAEKYYLQITNNLNIPEIDRAQAYNKLSIVYASVANHELAIECQFKGLELSKRSLGENSPMYAQALNQMGVIYMGCFQLEEAKDYFVRSLQLVDKLYGKDSEHYASTLGNLGVLYEYMAILYNDNTMNEIAYKYHRQVIDIKRHINNGQSISLATELNNMGVLCHILGKDDESEKYHLEALTLFKYTCGTNNIHYANNCRNLAVIYDANARYEEAEKLFEEASKIDRSHLEGQLFLMTEEQREAYWSRINLHYSSHYPSHTFKIYKHHPKTTKLMYDNILFAKGILLNVGTIIWNSILQSNNQELTYKWDKLQNQRQQLLTLYNYFADNNIEQQIDVLENECHKLESEIGQMCTDYREAHILQKVTSDSIKKSLDINELAIEFVSFENYLDHSTDSIMYCALLLRHDSEYPELIPLFEEKELLEYSTKEIDGKPATNLIYSYNINEGDTIGYAQNLSQLVWSKILPKIKEGETIYFAPSGLLHQLAIEHLPYGENRTMADVFNMVRLSFTREIVLNKPQSQYTSATIYGGIAYNVEEDILLAESSQYEADNLLASRSIKNDTLNRGTVKYLPGTKKEAEHIYSLLTKNNISAKLYTTTKANEESFKALSGKHNNILHIGTHGFTWTDSVAKKQDFFTQRMQLMGQEQHYDASIDPLNRCGLLFAGSNIALSGHSSELPEGVQDGILTAKEISLMDLRDADLVVLSACETAKGDITSEGVFGLQRAFKMAGVQTIIMSLWKVNDQATQLLMTEFYNNWIGKHQSKREAFRNAQNTVRTQYEEPEYWAGFVMLD